MSPIGFDANVLIYAIDTKAGEKRVLAGRLVDQALQTGRAFLPAQALAEFYSVCTRKLRRDPHEVLPFVNAWRATAHVESYDDTDIVSAAEANRIHNIPFWDALIWTVCDRMGVPVLVTEDLQDGRRLGGVTFLNPFSPANAARLGLTAE